MVAGQLLTDGGGEELLKGDEIVDTGDWKDTVDHSVVFLTSQPTITEEEIPVDEEYTFPRGIR